MYKKDYKNLLLAFIFITISSLMTTSFQFAKGYILEYATKGLWTEFLRVLIFVILISVVKSWSFYRYSDRFQVFRKKSLSFLRLLLVNSWLKMPYPVFREKSTGEHISIYTNNINLVDNSNFVSMYGLLQIVMEVLIAFVALFLIDIKILILCIVSLFPVVIVPALMIKLLSRLRKSSLESQNYNTEEFKDFFNGRKTIKQFNAEENFVEYFQKGNMDLYEKKLKTYVYAGGSQIFTNFLVQLSSLGVFFLSATLVVKGQISLAGLIASMGIMSEISGQVIYIAFYGQELKLSEVPLKEIKEIKANAEREKKEEYKKAISDINYKNITYSFDDEKAKLFNNFCLEVNGSGIYEIVGKSGCGKSTLMNLLLSYYPLSSGEILINNENIKSIGSLFGKITIMRQEAIFFDGSLKDNLTMFKNIESDKVINLMEELGMGKYADADFLNQVLVRPDEIFSGGEARRLMLVRALLRNTDVYIFDEPFANIDHLSIKKIEDILTRMEGKIIFLITHQEMTRREKVKKQIKLSSV